MNYVALTVRAWVPRACACLAALLLCLAVFAPRPAVAADARAAPEAATATSTATDRKPTRANTRMVVSANPHASRAGIAILRRGGAAIDAAIAMQMVLNVVEPQSSGIGGGAFLLHYARAGGAITAYDGRETAPAAASPDMFLDAGGAPLPFFEAVVGGLAVGAPGLLRMLELAHREHGRLPWRELFASAIRLARDGFAVSPRLHALIARDPYLGTFPQTTAYFYGADGAPRPIGFSLRNPALAATLELIARHGAESFYTGALAADIAAAVQIADPQPGRLTAADLADYRAVRREALCRPYRAWRVCTMPPPTSGGVTTLQILGILEFFGPASHRPGSVDAVHLVAEASRLAYADRGRYLADPDFIEVPVGGLLDRDYLARRAAVIRLDRTMGPASSGTPGRRQGALGAPPTRPERPSTSHLSVVDGEGNAVSMTSSIENAFGSRLMVRGFLLNNQLTDFSFVPDQDGAPIANRAAPGKRPRSSMAPTLVFDSDGGLVMAIGSPGGSAIIGYVAKTIIAVLDWRLDIQAAIDLPHHINLNSPIFLEAGTALEELAEALQARGHDVVIRPLNSGLHGITIGRDGLAGGADPRREGIALGD